MEITVNGHPREVTEFITIAQLISDMRLPPRFLAVERNLCVVPREQHEQCRLEPGDRLEIVTLVGGG